jgi:hypothetical protein
MCHVKHVSIKIPLILFLKIDLGSINENIQITNRDLSHRSG